MASPYKEAVLATAGLVSLWELGEESGSAVDLKGSNTGTYEGAPKRKQASILPNGEGKCVDLTPAADFISVADHATLDLGDTFSVEAWVNIDSFAARSGILSKGAGAYYLRVAQTTGKLEACASQSKVLSTSTVALTAGASAHVVFTKATTTTKIFLNGVDVSGVNDNVACVNTAVALNIGGDTGNGERADGRIQYPAVYSVAISEETAKAHSAAGSKSTGLGSPFPLGRRNRIVTF